MSNPASANSLSSPHSISSWQELLARPLQPCDVRFSERLAGKRVLITGAGGSIGSALSLAVHASGAASLTLLDTSENGLYQIDRSLREAGSQQHASILGSVCDGPTLVSAFEQHKPQIVLHAAALKHVPLMEQNPFAAITNNVLGTLSLTQTSIQHGAECLVLVSTDKAVDPLSIMGVSKRIAELILLTQVPSCTRFSIVRLCNVLGSQGSVLPLFLDQLARNADLTVTHPEAERYFITLDHAVASIFAALARNSSPRLLVPNPGPPLRILGLAEHLINAHASSSSVSFTGLRPGDKLAERLYSARERLLPDEDTGEPSLRKVLSPAPASDTLERVLEDLRKTTEARALASLLRAIHAVVPEYEPSSVLLTMLRTSNTLEQAAEVHA